MQLFDLHLKYFCQDYKYICMDAIFILPALCYSGNDLASVIFLMGKIGGVNHTTADEIPHPGKCIHKAGMKGFNGTADNPSLIHPPWFCNI
jgi:hypothetical protein